MKKKNEAVETVLCERVLSAEEVACISVQIQQELEAYIDPVKREYLPRFFKTGKGEYGEGDKEGCDEEIAPFGVADAAMAGGRSESGLHRITLSFS